MCGGERKSRNVFSVMAQGERKNRNIFYMVKIIFKEYFYGRKKFFMNIARGTFGRKKWGSGGVAPSRYVWKHNPSENHNLSDCWFQGKLLEGENFKNRNIASYGCDSFFDTCKFDFRENFWRAKRNLAQGFFFLLHRATKISSKKEGENF